MTRSELFAAIEKESAAVRQSSLYEHDPRFRYITDELADPQRAGRLSRDSLYLFIGLLFRTITDLAAQLEAAKAERADD